MRTGEHDPQPVLLGEGIQYVVTEARLDVVSTLLSDARGHSWYSFYARHSIQMTRTALIRYETTMRLQARGAVPCIFSIYVAIYIPAG